MHHRILTVLFLTLLVLTTGCNKVPDLRGMTKEQAQAALIKKKLTLGTVATGDLQGKAAGTVIDQSPAPNAKAPDNKTVSVVLEAGTSVTGTASGTNLAIVPDLSGSTQPDAEGKIQQAGLTRGTVNSVMSDKPAGKVFDQNPPAGVQVAVGTVVNFAIASDSTVTVPFVVGMPQAEAAQQIQSAQLTPEIVPGVHEGAFAIGTVFAQTPAQGRRVPSGQPVILQVRQEAVFVPPLVGLTLDQAKKLLYAKNLTPVVRNVLDTNNLGRVTAQTVDPGTAVAKGSQLGIAVGSDMKDVGRTFVLSEVGKLLASPEVAQQLTKLLPK